MIATNPRLKRFPTLDTKNNTDPITNSKISSLLIFLTQNGISIIPIKVPTPYARCSDRNINGNIK